MGIRRLLVRAAVAAVPFMSVASPADNSATPINALWNDADGFGIWLYGRAGSCAQFHYQAPPFIVVGPGGAHPRAEGKSLTAAEFPVCMLVAGKSQHLCSSGIIEWSFDRSTNEYRGRYEIRLANGEKWVGDFRAEHCKSK